MNHRPFVLLPLSLLLGACGSESPSGATTPDAATRPGRAAVSPGEDFFTYANADWIRAHPIPDDLASYTVFRQVADLVESDVKAIDADLEKDPAPDADARKLIDFMRAAKLAETRRFLLPKPLRDAFTALDAATSGAEILMIAESLRPYGVSAFHGFGAGSDAKNSDLVVAEFDEGGLTMPDRDYYLTDTAPMRTARGAMADYVATMLRHAGDDSAGVKTGADVLAFETKLAGLSTPMAERRDILKNYHPTSREGLSVIAPGIPWDAIKTGYGLSPERVVVISRPNYFSGLDALLATTPVETLKAYVRFRALDASAPYINAETARESFAFHGTVLAGVKTQRPAALRAIEARDAALGELVGKRYVARHFPAVLRARYLAMCENFRTVLDERFAANTWMDEPTRKRAREKLAQMRFKIGYPDVWTDYSRLEISAEDHALNMLEAARFRFARNLERVGKSPDRDRWGMNPQKCNAYFNPSNNELVFPAAIFVVPGVDPLTIDDAMAYGHIGAVIGHEMTHAFDDEGRKYDGKGNLSDWWTPESAAAFGAKTAPIVKRYSEVSPLPGVPINGAATLGENIADLGGLAIALDAFKRTGCFKSGAAVGGEPPVRRFFLAFAYTWAGSSRPEEARRRLLSDVHSPMKARVNLVVPNFPEFQEAFGVKPGDKLWLPPEERSTVW